MVSSWCPYCLMLLKRLTDREYVFIRLQADFELFFFTVSKTGNFRQQFIKIKKNSRPLCEQLHLWRKVREHS